MNRSGERELRGTAERRLFPFAFGQRGFTLAELIAVLVIAGILSVGVTILFDRSTFDAAAFSDLAKSAVSQAQKVAIAQRRTIYVVSTAGSLSVCYDAACTAPVPALGGGSAPTSMVYAAPAGVTLSAASFSFDGLGRPSAPATIAVSGGSTITVAAETGYVF